MPWSDRESTLADIFVSYDREDSDRVAELITAFKRQGWSVFWDRQIPAGQNWDDVLEREITSASCVVVVWTNNSVASQWVRTEALEGMERNILVPVRFDDVDLPFVFRRVHIQGLQSTYEASDRRAKRIQAVTVIKLQGRL